MLDGTSEVRLEVVSRCSKYAIPVVVKMKRITFRLCVLLVLAAVVTAVPASAQVTVIFTRHAEKGTTPPKIRR